MEASKRQEKGGGNKMAVTSIPFNSKVSLIFQTGTDPATGAPIKRTKSYTNIKSTASDQDVYDTAIDLVDLQKYTLLEVQRTDREKLTE